MEKKEYQILNAAGTDILTAYQSELSIRQAKEITAFYTKHQIELNDELTPREIMAQIIEKDAAAEFCNIVLRNNQGQPLIIPLKEDDISFQLFQQIAGDFFMSCPGWVVLFGSSSIRQAMTREKISSIPTDSSSKTVSPSSSENTSGAEKSSNSGTDSALPTVN